MDPRSGHWSLTLDDAGGYFFAVVLHWTMCARLLPLGTTIIFDSHAKW